MPPWSSPPASSPASGHGATINRVFFPHAGVVSLVVELASGEMIEAAMIGKEGVVGGLSALDSNISISRAIVQIAFLAIFAALYRSPAPAATPAITCVTELPVPPSQSPLFGQTSSRAS